ncbi:hypothetical protein PSHT_10951 [Puccinia striiformis]|uniref:Uncharacterized protein n=1 Tax=Puccinia striiformis TaxID=27350 RepID=A0A2S4V6K3_9BASI|nr:hypothetical protein PSHT_10951 [Puccinia striiformis]
MASQLTLTDLLNQSHDPKTNPFTGVILGLKEQQNPAVDEAQARGILYSIITYNVVFLVCAAIICLPYLQGVGGHQRRHWIIKRQYLDSRKHRFLGCSSSFNSPQLVNVFPYLTIFPPFIPGISHLMIKTDGQSYWIPNSGLIVAVSHLLGSTLFLVFLGLRYSAFHSGVAADAFYGSAWLELRWLPSYCSFFTQAWSTWFVRASDASLNGKTNRIHPVAYNINLIGFPLIALVFALVLTSAQVSAMTARSESFRTLLSTLTLISLQWREGQDFAHIHQFSAASAQFHDYTLKSLHLLARFRTTGLFWTLMAVPTFIFYIFGICTLLKVMHKRFQAAKSQPEEQSTTGTDSFGKRLISGHHQDKSSKLRNSFSTQPSLKAKIPEVSVDNNSLIFFSLLGSTLYDDVDDLVLPHCHWLDLLSLRRCEDDQDWMQLFMVLSNSGSYLLLAALLVQMLRIISEGREQAHRIARSRKNSDSEDTLLDDFSSQIGTSPH